ncbi:ABC transporter ATP-binding protein [Streptomyces fuscigenes]|uniref:ABC transporter ATP-binding protein n=1 Tax=Streptomyces fuscigenes TaxID=1528880 RepID=UPI001F284DFE|nr:ABC transporter ATP-binding protein [Streptomyces fuscigenes]MCF3964200.1 ABC transporter ATP-binding protein [Streptomyces fuscigenes]
MPLLTLQDVTVRFGARAALDAVRLDVAEHEIVSVLGPSGSGKSTLLRVVAGLQAPDSGRVLLAGADQAPVPVHRRGVGLMFQDHQLFPQRDVAGNVAFGLRMHGVPRGEQAERVEELLELVGLPGAGGRSVAALSGGEQQRVALARALAPRPRLLMLDEPLGQLDRGLRERLVVELRGLFQRLGTTVLAVTHDQGEAFALADRVVVMGEGRVAQTGTPLEVWQRPASAFVARFLGFDNLAPATVGGGVADTPWGKLPLPPGVPEGERTVLVRPAGLRLAAAGAEPGAGGGLRCTVEARAFRGGRVGVRLRPTDGAPPLDAECALADAPREGDTVAVTFAPGDVLVLPGAPERAEDGRDAGAGPAPGAVEAPGDATRGRL